MTVFAILAALIGLAILILSAVDVTYAATCTVVETLTGNTDSAPDSTRKVTHTQFNESATLNATSTQPATKVAEFILTLTAGAATIDLTALTGTNGATVDGTGLKVQVLRVKNLGANLLTFTAGLVNGYNISGAAGVVEVLPGGHVQMFFNDSSPDVAAADKTIDVAGTGAQTSEWTIVLG